MNQSDTPKTPDDELEEIIESLVLTAIDSEKQLSKNYEAYDGDMDWSEYVTKYFINETRVIDKLKVREQRIRIDELEKLRKKFHYDEYGNYLGALHQMAVAADVEAIHRVIDERLSQLKNNPMPDETKGGA